MFAIAFGGSVQGRRGPQKAVLAAFGPLQGQLWGLLPSTFSKLSAMEKDFWSFIARQTLARSQDFLHGRVPQPAPCHHPVLLPWSVALAIMLQQQEKILTFIACANELVLLRLQHQLQLLQLRLRLLLVLPVPCPFYICRAPSCPPFQFLYPSLPHHNPRRTQLAFAFGLFFGCLLRPEPAPSCCFAEMRRTFDVMMPGGSQQC